MNGVPFAILRHASTAWNEQRRLQGLTDTTLSAAGEAEARRWRLPPPAAGWPRLSSPLQRARRTAELLQPPAAVTIDSALREMSFGAWEGYTIAELRRDVGEAFLAAERRGLDFQPPGGESPRAAMTRIGGWAARIAATGQPVVAVSHKAAIRALLALATGWDMTGRPPHKLDWRSVHFFTARSRWQRCRGSPQRCSDGSTGRGGMSARVFFHVQHLLGIGHLRRAATLARALAAGGFDVLLVSGGAPIPGLALGAARFHQLPPLRAADETLKDLSRLDGTPLDEAFAGKRAQELLDLLRCRGARHSDHRTIPLRPHPAAFRADAASRGGEGDAPAAVDRFLGARCGAPFGLAAAGRGVGRDLRKEFRFRPDPRRSQARRVRAELCRLGPHQVACPLYRLCRGARSVAAVPRHQGARSRKGAATSSCRRAAAPSVRRCCTPPSWHGRRRRWPIGRGGCWSARTCRRPSGQRLPAARAS